MILNFFKKNSASLLLATLLFSACEPAKFDLHFYLTLNGTSGVPITDGMVALQFNGVTPFPFTEPDGRGIVSYRGLPGKYLDDSIRLVYQPTGNRRYRVVDQSAYTAQNVKNIYFSIDFPSDNTSFEWSLRDAAGNGIEGATVKAMDGKFTVQTGANGYFTLSLPKPAGEKVLFTIEKDGKTLLNREIEIAPEYRRLTIDNQ